MLIRRNRTPAAKIHVRERHLSGTAERGGVGFTYARLGVSRREKGPWKVVRLLVDTGASYSMLPRRVLDQLGVRPRSRMSFRLADGRKVARDVAFVWTRYGKDVIPTRVIVGEPGDAALLGVVTLEELGLRIDPKTQRLRKVKVHLLVPVMSGLF